MIAINRLRGDRVQPTHLLASFATRGSHPSAFPEWCIHEAKRTLINIIGVSLSASTDAPSLALTEWADGQGSNHDSTIIGHVVRASPENAALVNGFLGHLHDYDDTHFPTILHPSAPIWPAILAMAEKRESSGIETLNAFIIGAEIACRVAMSVHPWHYNQGWHITSTTGGFGAAAATGYLLSLNTQQLTHALGIVGTQSFGFREVFGTQAKGLHAGKSAANGLQAAILAAAGFTGPQDIIGGRRGFWAIMSADGHNQDALISELGTRWELGNNGLKPYANGVVSHPIQDAVIVIRESIKNHHNGLVPMDKVHSIKVLGHPLVQELMGNLSPMSGLEAKFSFAHCAAAALIDGSGHESQFSDSKVNDPDLAAMRAKVSLEINPAYREDEASVTIAMTDGQVFQFHTNHATGSPSNPMTDTQLENKFLAVASESLPPNRASRLLEELWVVDSAPNIKAITSLLIPALDRKPSIG
jgi:2-methylcitrate dehydratase PrpD